MELEKFIIEKMSENKMLGISIALVEDGEVVYSRGFGFRNLENGAPATSRTVYGIGSITKSFTALAIMQLVEKGLISLDDPVEKYIPIKLRPFWRIRKNTPSIGTLFRNPLTRLCRGIH